VSTATDYINRLRPLMGQGMTDELKAVVLEAAGAGFSADVLAWMNAESDRMHAEIIRQTHENDEFEASVEPILEGYRMLGVQTLGEMFDRAAELGYSTIREAIEGERSKRAGA